MKNILVICGHPAAHSLCDALAESYAGGARAAGHKVDVLRLGTLRFDPYLHDAYKKLQEQEPDLQAAQQLIKNADHLVFVFPSWWGSMPALLKGFIDRVFTPGFAFRYRKNSEFVDRLLKGKTARILLTMDAPRFWNYLMYRDANIHGLKQATLKFCGIRPVSTTIFSRVRFSDEQKRQSWLNKSEKLGRMAA